MKLGRWINLKFAEKEERVEIFYVDDNTSKGVEVEMTMMLINVGSLRQARFLEPYHWNLATVC